MIFASLVGQARGGVTLFGTRQADAERLAAAAGPAASESWVAAEQALSLLSFESPTGQWFAQLRDNVTLNGGSWTDLSLGMCVIP